MVLGKEIGSFSFKITSTHYHDDVVTLDCDGTADGFGTALGTLILALGDPDAKSGAASWRGQAFPDSGEALQAVGEGAWQELGNHKWRTRLVISISDGQIFGSDGEIDLASRSLSGKNIEWT